MPERDPLRVMDAKLHEALYGGKCEWQTLTWSKGDIEVVEDVPVLDRFGLLYVPYYSTDIAAAWKAEGDLKGIDRVKYLVKLQNIVNATRGWGEEWEPDLWVLRRATPEQMVRAMCEALGVKDGA